jgi:hypothetical protein
VNPLKVHEIAEWLRAQTGTLCRFRTPISGSGNYSVGTTLSKSDCGKVVPGPREPDEPSHHQRNLYVSGVRAVGRLCRCLSAGMKLRTCCSAVQTILGHSNLFTTSIYANAIPQPQRRAIDNAREILFFKCCQVFCADGKREVN